MVVNLAFQILKIEDPLESLIVNLKPPNFRSLVLLMLTSGWRRIYCAKTFTFSKVLYYAIKKYEPLRKLVFFYNAINSRVDCYNTTPHM